MCLESGEKATDHASTRGQDGENEKVYFNSIVEKKCNVSATYDIILLYVFLITPSNCLNALY